MLRRLAEFRANNTEDDTVLNFFDENEIHPIVINAVEDPSEDMTAIFCVITEKVGSRKGFQLTPEEEAELVRAEQERLKLLEEEAQLQRDVGFVLDFSDMEIIDFFFRYLYKKRKNNITKKWRSGPNCWKMFRCKRKKCLRLNVNHCVNI